MLFVILFSVQHYGHDTTLSNVDHASKQRMRDAMKLFNKSLEKETAQRLSSKKGFQLITISSIVVGLIVYIVRFKSNIPECFILDMNIVLSVMFYRNQHHAIGSTVKMLFVNISMVH